jgi:DNA-binding MarR family transcriptional regulator
MPQGRDKRGPRRRRADRDGEAPATDSVDRVVAGWREARPELPVAPIEVIARLQRIRSCLDQELETTFAEEGLTGPGFSVLATLTRLGDRVPQRALMDELRLTSGTVSVRVDRLVDAGLVVREPDPRDARGAVVSLTAAGRSIFERCAPIHLANEERLLAALGEDERAALADLLRRLLISFEGTRPLRGSLPHLGLTLAPAHVAIEMRRAVGLPARTGLLVRAVADDGAAAGKLEPGDVLTAAGGRELRSIATLYRALRDAAGSDRLQLAVARGADELRVSLDLAASPPPALADEGPTAPRRREAAYQV